MERLRYRSTSLLALQAELRQRELAAEAERARRRVIAGETLRSRWHRLILPVLPAPFEPASRPD